MTFKITCELDYTVTSPLTFLLNIRAQKNARQKVLEEKFHLTPTMPHVKHADEVTGNRFDQITAQVPGIYQVRYEALVENSPEILSRKDLVDTEVHEFSLEVLACLYASRYCQSDRLGNLAAQQFGHCETPIERVLAVIAWISEHIAYVSGSTNASTSAVDSLVERQGVCRDFAHLGIAMCRAMNIPARYFTAYAHELNPPDFHACFETWVGGRWLLWDATGLASPDGVVHIGTGRDAAEVSVCTSFGNLQLERQNITCEAMDENYQKLTAEQLQQVFISHA
ncbi:transglutaminase family protein [Prosthecobacter algae]|uniref:Transglutaminase family protein n=1 Tax=Prosthecobacter algae TaxID=1144682 RepID=A0ABP9P824_9BACT